MIRLPLVSLSGGGLALSPPDLSPPDGVSLSVFFLSVALGALPLGAAGAGAGFVPGVLKLVSDGGCFRSVHSNRLRSVGVRMSMVQTVSAAVATGDGFPALADSCTRPRKVGGAGAEAVEGVSLPCFDRPDKMSARGVTS